MHLSHALTHLALRISGVSLPNPDAVQPPGTAGLVTLLSWLKWGGFAAAIAGIIAGAIMLMVSSRRGEGAEHGKQIGIVLIAVILVGASSGLVGAIASA
ncbi:MAG: hypothetical protein M0Z51_06480 [Propionibacterium sp.]|nr:hypothetical protein [Propionibacterium sp.]